MPDAAPSTVFEAVLDLGTTGLVGTLGVRIIDNDGNTVLARATAGIIEHPANSGLYQVNLTAPALPGQYSIVWDDAEAPTTHYAIDELVVTSALTLPDIGQPGAGLGPCTSWISGTDVMACCSVETTDSTIFDSVAAEASEILYQLSGRLYPGICERTVRPCRTSCGCGWQSLSRGYIVWHGNRWTCDEAPCGCSSLSSVWLAGYPVQSIVSVKIDGVVVSPTTYRLDEHRFLVRVRDPLEPDVALQWPGCQNLDLEDDQDGTFSVTYLHGQEPPLIATAAASQLACELYKACDTAAECALPQGVTRVTRQGIIVEKQAFAAWAFAGGAWRTGMQLVDSFLSVTNPSALKRRPTIYSPASHLRFARPVGS